MNNSTEGVTLNAVFINDILGFYDKKEYPELYRLVRDVDLSAPDNKVPIDVYNKLCDWIEENLGKFNLIKVGRKIGETVYQVFIQYQMIQADAQPIDVLKALQTVAATMIQDPEGRGWVIVANEPQRIVMRRTQTFNSQLQLGLLDGLVRKTGKRKVEVTYFKEVQAGADFDEYQISWE